MILLQSCRVTRQMLLIAWNEMCFCIICSEIYKFVINCYTSPAWLLVTRKGELWSQKSTTGNPIAMDLYALGTTQLVTAFISSIESEYHFHNNHSHNVAFADDFTGCRNLESLK